MLLSDLAKNPAFGSVEAVERAIRDGTFARKLGHVSSPGEHDDMDMSEDATRVAKPAHESTKSLPAHLALD